MPRPLSPPEPRTAAGPNPTDAARFPRLAGYRFQKLLGQGGMAAVYLATQESLDRPVAIKVMERDALTDEISMQRFENEARTIAQLTHPSIVHIYEVGRTSDGRMYYIMPYLANGDLEQRDMRGKEDQVVDILRNLLSALEYAHARGIVHRDVKAGNVLFDVADRPLLTDFGIALSRRDSSRITSAGLAVGSSGYMAPEQARGDVVDGRADLYSVGVLAYELLTGRLPFRSPDALALALMHAQNPVPRLPPSKQHWQSFINRAMSKSPDYRYRDATQMIEALERVDRRSNRHFSGRFLRGFDKTLDGSLWKHPGTIALFGLLMISVGLYSARDRLPFVGSSAESGPVPVAADPTPQPAAAAPLPSPLPQVAAPAPVPSPAIAPPANTQANAAPADPAPIASASAQATKTVAAAVPVVPPAAATPTVVTPPSAAPSPAIPPAVAASTAPPSITPDAAVSGEARTAIAHGNLTSPADDNAVDLTLMSWKLSPATAGNKLLSADVLKAIAVQEALAIDRRHDQKAQDYQKKAEQLADATIGRTGPAWRAFRASASAALTHRVDQQSDPLDAKALKRTGVFAKQLDLSLAYTDAVNAAQQRAQQQALLLAQQKAAAAAAAAAAANAVPAGFVLMYGASNGHPGAALSRTEVTRHEYEQFVNATQRPASTCGNKVLGIFGKNRSWTDPGFAQTAGQPAVCVSWNDANAYVQWLSARSGQHYRLPSTADLHQASPAADAATKSAGLSGIEASYSDWLQDCATDCKRHLVAGRSWHEGKDTSTSHPGDNGFDDVSFRIVRVMDAHH